MFLFQILSGSGSRSTAVAKLANSKLDRKPFLCSLNQTFVFTWQTSLVAENLTLGGYASRVYYPIQFLPLMSKEENSYSYRDALALLNEFIGVSLAAHSVVDSP
jgi:hypothetical protein